MDDTGAVDKAGSAASHGGGQDLLRQYRVLTAGDADTPRFAYAFEDAAALFGGRLVIVADPRQLDLQFHYEVEAGAEKFDPSQFFLGSGDWSSFLQPLDKSPVYIQAVQLKDSNFVFQQTGMYKRLRYLVVNGHPVELNNVAIDTVGKLDAYFRNYREMLIRVTNHGIRRRPPSQLDDDPGRYRLNEARPLWAELSERDVGVAVDRDGRLHRIGPGKHRTAAAKVLGVERMPCEVRMVHADWLRGRLPQVVSPVHIIQAIRTLSLPPLTPTDSGVRP